MLGSLICFLVFVFIRSDEWNWLIYSVASLVSIIFFIYGIIHYYENKFRLKISGIILYFLLISLYWMMMGLMMFTKVMASFLPAISDIGFFYSILASSLFMLFVLYFMIVPGIPMAFWYGVGVAVVLLPPLINPIAVKLADVSLKTLKIGGSYQTMYILNKEYSSVLPCQLINNDYPDRTVPVYVVLDIGKRIYVKLEKDEIVYTLNEDEVITQIYWNGMLTKDDKLDI